MSFSECNILPTSGTTGYDPEMKFKQYSQFSRTKKGPNSDKDHKMMMICCNIDRDQVNEEKHLAAE